MDNGRYEVLSQINLAHFKYKNRYTVYRNIDREIDTYIDIGNRMDRWIDLDWIIDGLAPPNRPGLTTYHRGKGWGAFLSSKHSDARRSG